MGEDDVTMTYTGIDYPYTITSDINTYTAIGSVGYHVADTAYVQPITMQYPDGGSIKFEMNHYGRSVTVYVEDMSDVELEKLYHSCATELNKRATQ